MGLLRFLLAFSVSLMHGGDVHFANINFVFGFDAVIFFFMISGFYMTLILNSKYNSPLLFYLNRALRLYPAYWIVLAFCMFMYPKGYVGPWTTVALFDFMNISMWFTQLTSLLDCSTPNLGFIGLNGAEIQNCSGILYIAPVWSLSIELLFYALAPFVVKFGKSYLYKMAFLFGISVLYIVITILLKLPTLPFRYNFFLPNLLWFVLGSLAYYAHLNGVFYKYIPNVRFSQISFFYAIIFSSLVYSLVPFFNFRLYFYAAMIFVGLPYLFTLDCQLKGWIKKLDYILGEVSYPLYICHQFVIHELSKLITSLNPILLMLVISCLISVLTLPVESLRRLVAKKSIEAS